MTRTVSAITLAVALFFLWMNPTIASPRSEATPFPELPEKFRSSDGYWDEEYERPGNEPVLVYTAWGSSMAGYLKKVGYADTEIYRIDLALFQGWGSRSPREYVDTLDAKLKRIRKEHGKDVDIIAHSLGGLTARWYVEEAGGTPYVDDLITLAAPNQGGYVFYGIYFMPAGQAMVPRSGFLSQLNSSPLAKNVEYTAVWSGIDEVFLFNIFGSTGGQLPRELIEEHGNARNIFGGYKEHIELAVAWDTLKKHEVPGLMLGRT